MKEERKKEEGRIRKSAAGAAATAQLRIFRRELKELERVTKCQADALREAWGALLEVTEKASVQERLLAALSTENARLVALVAEFKQAETDRAMKLIRNNGHRVPTNPWWRFYGQ